MEIEIIEEPTNDNAVESYQELLTFFNKEIYSKMKLKDSEIAPLKIKVNQAIDNYCNNKATLRVLKATFYDRKQLKNQQEIIEGLRNGTEENKVYRKRSDNYVGD